MAGCAPGVPSPEPVPVPKLATLAHPKTRSMAMDRKSADELQEHMLGTYYGLRVGLAAIGFALPLVVLFAGGLLHHVWLLPSISDYYYPGAHARPFLTTRDLFVGGLFATGACLYLYKGFSTKENVALNLAGIFACAVALLPTGDRGIVPLLHGTSAVLFFLCIAYVSLFRSRDTIRLLPPEKRPRYARMYVATGVAMVVSPLLAVLLAYTVGSRRPAIIFWVETCAVWAFALYWMIKTGEMRQTRAEKRALDAELRRERVPAAPPPAAGAAQADGMSGVVLGKLAPASGTVERIVPADAPAGAIDPRVRS
jgi:hypothetical protein